jgi:hypothetical protein
MHRQFIKEHLGQRGVRTRPEIGWADRLGLAVLGLFSTRFGPTFLHVASRAS